MRRSGQINRSQLIIRRLRIFILSDGTLKLYAIGNCFRFEPCIELLNC
jgi:hypothetical protein